MNPTSDEEAANRRRFLAEMRGMIASGEIETADNEAYLAALRMRYPHDFPTRSEAFSRRVREESYEAKARGVFEEVVNQTGLEDTDRVAIFGGKGMGDSILAPVRIVRERFKEILSFPRSFFLAAEDVSWCMAFQYRRRIVFRRAIPQSELGTNQKGFGAACPPPPARLYAILAREAPVGVIFRRGPTAWVQMVHWDTSTDTFTPGQWFHGRVYDHRSDLSPDGTKLIYFAAHFSRRAKADTEYTYAWTAISKPPYYTALALWPKGDCWHGGGLFETNDRVWLNHRLDRAIPHPDHLPRGLEIVPNPEAYGEDGPVEGRRQERDGWSLRREMIWHEVGPGRPVTDQTEIVVKRSADGKRVLREEVTMYGWVDFRYEYTVESVETGVATPVPCAVWADWDQNGRLVFAREGRIFAGEIDSDGQLQERELVDLNGARPETVPPPEWAASW
ncbi:MAG TPA: hypothetical protein VGM37_10880 [Armatimonadota bacterium]|jgi:hypothetical protein